MKNKRGYLYIIFIVLVFIGLEGSRYYNIIAIHRKIDANDVESIKIYGTAIKGEKYATTDEIKDIINWFNSATDLRRNRYGEGVGTPESNILIQLKSGAGKKIINILKSGQDFEIQRYDKMGNWVCYWGKQADIKRVLKEAAGE